MRTRVFAIILNWNGADDTVDCVLSCQKSTYPFQEIVVVDNKSEDRSLQIITSRCPGVTILRNEENFGYAGGNNVGIRYALEKGAEKIFIINNDTGIDRDCVQMLLDAESSHTQAGIIAPKILYGDDSGLINSLGTEMDWFKLRPFLSDCGQRDGESFRHRVVRRSILVGCALFVSREVIAKVGLLNEEYFLIHEDADWCFRSLKAGFQNLAVSDAVVYHKNSRSLSKVPMTTYYYSVRNFLILASKHAGWIDRLRVSLGLLFYLAQHLVFYMSPRGLDRGKARAFFCGVCDFFKRKRGRCQRELEIET